MQWNLSPKQSSSYFSEKCGTFSVMETNPTSVNNLVLFYSYGYILINPFNYCMQWNLNPKKRLPTSVNNVVLFSFMDTYYLTPLITVCSETSIQQKHIHTSVKNVVLFSSYGDRTYFSEQCGYFFSYGDILLNPFN